MFALHALAVRPWAARARWVQSDRRQRGGQTEAPRRFLARLLFLRRFSCLCFLCLCLCFVFLGRLCLCFLCLLCPRCFFCACWSPWRRCRRPCLPVALGAGEAVSSGGMRRALQAQSETTYRSRADSSERGRQVPLRRGPDARCSVLPGPEAEARSSQKVPRLPGGQRKLQVIMYRRGRWILAGRSEPEPLIADATGVAVPGCRGPSWTTNSRVARTRQSPPTAAPMAASRRRARRPRG
jgi:hypothetical protein